MSSKDASASDAVTDTVGQVTGDDSGETPVLPKDEQLSPFHRITLSRTMDCSVHKSRVDSPRAVVAKMKKSAPLYNSTSTASDSSLPARRGRRAKNCGRKKTSDTAAKSNTLEIDSRADEAVETAAGKMVNGSDTLLSVDERMRTGKSDLLRSGVVDGTTTGNSASDGSELTVSDKPRCADARSDTEQKLPDCDEAMVKNRRCTSVPVRNSRKGGNSRKADQSHKITEYFPIRRSSRMTTTELKKQELIDIQESIRGNRRDGLKVEEIPCKGRGVITTRPFTKGEFVVEYAGDLVDLGVAKQREKNYSMNQHVGCYMYYFQHKTKNYCVDATAESGLLGRLVNHSRLKFNCCTKVVEVDDRPRLILVAARDITADEELLYDYGDRSKESLEAYPWLAS